jgi:hypothetical protein
MLRYEGDHITHENSYIKISLPLGQHKAWFNKGYSEVSDQRKQAELQWLQDPIRINGYNLNVVRHFRNKKKEYLKVRINALAMHSKNKRDRGLCRGLNDFRAY